jgi:two-component system, OmpR family, response regulator
LSTGVIYLRALQASKNPSSILDKRCFGALCSQPKGFGALFVYDPFFRAGDPMRLLLIEDDAQLRAFIVKGATELGHTVEAISDGKQGMLLALSEPFDAIVLDRMLPGLGGMEILKALRATQNRTPVIVLSSLGDVEQRVEGLKAGADDYLAKPFSFIELNARLESIIRRSHSQAESPTVLKVADLELDLLKRSVKRGTAALDIQGREFKMLEYFMRNANRLVTRTMLLEGVWDYHFDPQTNVIDVHISRLRQKIDTPGRQALIHTIRGSGYLLGERS